MEYKEFDAHLLPTDLLKLYSRLNRWDCKLAQRWLFKILSSASRESQALQTRLTQGPHDHITVSLSCFKISNRSKNVNGTAVKWKNTCLAFFQRGHIHIYICIWWGSISLENERCHPFVSAGKQGTESVTSLPWVISKSNSLLISFHLLSIILENWLMGGELRCRSIIIRSHPLPEQALPMNSYLSIWQDPPTEDHINISPLFLCGMKDAISVRCVKCLYRLQPITEVPGTRQSYGRSASVLQESLNYFNLLLAYCIKPQKFCHWQLILCKLVLTPRSLNQATILVGSKVEPKAMCRSW